jgi:hypothetical protein
MSLPSAGSQLIRQVRAHSEDATYQPVGDPDGFGRHRSVEFDKDTSKWLKPIMEVIAEGDDRVAEVGTKSGKLRVTFVGDIRADSRRPYEIQAVEEVLNGDDKEGK